MTKQEPRVVDNLPRASDKIEAKVARLMAFLDSVPCRSGRSARNDNRERPAHKLAA